MGKFGRVMFPVVVAVTLLVIGTPVLLRASPVPEIDATTGMSALTLLSGAILVIRGRHKK